MGVSQTCGRGGIGRRAALRSLWGKLRGSSSLLDRTSRSTQPLTMRNTRLSSLDFDLGPEIDMLRTTVRGFAEDRVTPLAAEIDRTDRFPVELWPEMGVLGLHGITVEQEYGGAG